VRACVRACVRARAVHWILLRTRWDGLVDVNFCETAAAATAAAAAAAAASEHRTSCLHLPQDDRSCAKLVDCFHTVHVPLWSRLSAAATQPSRLSRRHVRMYLIIWNHRRPGRLQIRSRHCGLRTRVLSMRRPFSKSGLPSRLPPPPLSSPPLSPPPCQHRSIPGRALQTYAHAHHAAVRPAPLAARTVRSSPRRHHDLPERTQRTGTDAHSRYVRAAARDAERPIVVWTAARARGGSRQFSRDAFRQATFGTSDVPHFYSNLQIENRKPKIENQKPKSKSEIRNSKTTENWKPKVVVRSNNSPLEPVYRKQWTSTGIRQHTVLQGPI
jgi:hypothetical protein